MKAMVFAAGLGTRLRPLTDSRPKALVEVGGKPLVRHIVEKLQRFGYDDIVLNIHHFADMIEEYFRSTDFRSDSATDGGMTNALRISFSDERDLLRDTGGGLLHARPLLEDAESFLVHNVDALTNLDFSLLDNEPRQGTASETCPSDAPQSFATLVVSDRPTSRYLLFDEDMRLVGWQNLRTGEIRSPYLKTAGITSKLGIDAPAVRACPELHNARPYAFAGIHKISSAIFPHLQEYASTHGEVFSIIDFYISLCADIPIYGFIPKDFKMLDVGKLDSLPLAEKFL